MRDSTTSRASSRYLRAGIIIGLGIFASSTVQTRQQPGRARGQGGASTYIVRLAEAPVVANDGNVPGFGPTRPQRGAKIDPESGVVMAYAGYLTNRHDSVLASVGGGRKLHSYVYTFNGFSAQLTDAQAEQLRAMPGILTVWKDEELTLDTNRTPAFLGLSGAGGLWSQLGGADEAGEDIVIGMVDSGFWPEHPSFSDRVGNKLVYQYIPHWKGQCHPAEAFNASHCNQKVIGARYYNEGFGGPEAVKARYPNDFNSPRDGASHGSHTASTAGGNANVAAIVDGINLGAISGMAPRARLSIYKTCYGDGVTSACFTSDSVAAIDQAVADGVDVLNYSISGSRTSNIDPIEIAFLFAADAGVFVAASAGNSGPTASTVAHNSPWLMTVAAGTHDRFYAAGVTLGNGASYFGASVANGTPNLPVILASTAGLPGLPADQVQQCWSDNTGGGLVPPTGPPGPRLDPAKIAGKIVVCDRGVSARVDKSLAVKNAGGLGMILTNVVANTLDADLHSVPTVHVAHTDRAAIYTYVSTAAQPMAMLLPGVVSGGLVAPDVAGFSSRGPALAAGGDLLKPDIMAPGVAVLAAVSPASPTSQGRSFDFFQGTSMSSPHLAGIGALMKQRHPEWSPAMIKSALMTTASQVRNNGTPIAGGPFAFGSGHVDPNKAVDPGLVYDAGFTDWLGFLCGSGQVTGCGSLTIDPSDLNYPSIAIGALLGTQTVRRTVTNVADLSSTYTVSVVAPAGMTVTVSPSSFTVAPGASAEYTVTFTRTTAAAGVFALGSITWSDGAGHAVRSPFAVRPLLVVAPAEVSSDGSPISYGVTFGYSGTFGAAARGLVPATTTNATVADDPSNSFVPGGPGTVSFPITIPTGTTLARFALFDDATDGADDLDLYVLQGTTIIAASAGFTSAERVTFTVNPASLPIPLTVVVHGFATDGPDANFTLFNWNVGTAPAGNMSISAPSPVVVNTTGTVGISFTGLAPATRYLGVAAYQDGSGFLGPTTIVSVNKP